jgi:hypothetical protein
MASTIGRSDQQEGLTEQASVKAQEVTSVAQEKAMELREEGSMRLRDQLNQRSTQAGSQVRSVAEALRKSGSELRTEGNSNAGRLTSEAADRLERLATYLEEMRGEEIMRDVESFARRRPWMLAGLGLLAGAATARFMKASSEQRYDKGQASNWPRDSSAREIAGAREEQAEAMSASASR